MRIPSAVATALQSLPAASRRISELPRPAGVAGLPQHHKVWSCPIAQLAPMPALTLCQRSGSADRANALRLALACSVASAAAERVAVPVGCAEAATTVAAVAGADAAGELAVAGATTPS